MELSSYHWIAIAVVIGVLIYLMRTSTTESFHQNASLYYFYSPRCGHCQNFMSEWQRTEQKLSPRLNLKKIDATQKENEDLTFYYNVDAFPTIILITPNKNIEYQGERNADAIEAFVVSNLNN